MQQKRVEATVVDRIDGVRTVPHVLSISTSSIALSERVNLSNKRVSEDVKVVPLDATLDSTKLRDLRVEN